MSQKDLTQVIEKYYYENLNLKTEKTQILCVEPLIPLSQIQLENLDRGDGQTPGQFKQVNSSTGLAVNYYKLLEEQNKNIENLIFEDKVERPLKRGRYANLDVSYLCNGVMYYVESKFLEPYYSNNEKNSDSYENLSRYSSEVDCKEQWIELFKQAKDYQYYNVSQLCRHLLAIYKHSIKLQKSQKKVPQKTILQSVSWKMTDSFINMLPEIKRNELQQRMIKIEEEKEKCRDCLNNFLSKLNNSYNIKFEIKQYNDETMLNPIKNHKLFEDFCKRYLLIKQL